MYPLIRIYSVKNNVTCNLDFQPINNHILLLFFSHSPVISNVFQPHGLQHARLPCLSPSPWACSSSSPVSWWCHPTISFSAIPFSSCLQSCPASGFFPNKSALHIRWPRYWSLSFSISPSNEYSGLISFRIDCFSSLKSKGLARVFCNTTVQNHQFFNTQPSLWSISQIHTWLLENL